ncbi:MAG: single-stranded-DNA-specific exonuclease RecJ [Clostridia bacterium]|nr:single-stranded-DNA-specific exonuclease RecJ [Clostridia bacterium]
MIRFRCKTERTDFRPIQELPGWLSAILRARGMSTYESAERFLNPDISMLHDPDMLDGMQETVRLIRKAAAEGMKTVVYGDYDVDGVCATAIMLETLREIGISADFRIPDRHTEGYGLHEDIIRDLARDHQLLITVDCGITNIAETKLARELGMTVIVTDHHEPGEILPEADAVMDPLLGDYPFRRLCGAGVALKICQALLGNEGVTRRIELAALATVADVVPLLDENRVIVKEGLKKISSASCRPGITALMRESGINEPLKASGIAFRLAPRLNAGGRLEHAGQCVTLLMTEDSAEADRIAHHLEENNRKRQEIEHAMLGEAEDLIRRDTDFVRDRVLIAAGEDWNNGIIGLTAGRICEKYHYPTIILSVNGDTAVGSCRSIPGVNIYRMLSECADLFERFGGHEQAAGLTIRTERIGELRERLNETVRRNCDPECYLPVGEYDLAIRLKDISLDMTDLLEMLEPTGCGNPPPAFLTTGVYVQEARRVGKDGGHLKLSLLDGDSRLDGIAFSKGYLAEDDLRCIDILYTPQRNEFNGKVTAQAQVAEIRAVPGKNTIPDNDQNFGMLLQEIRRNAANDTGCSGTGETGAVSEASVRMMLKEPQGTLALTFDRNRACSLAAETGADTAIGKVRDGRCFSTVLFAPDMQCLTGQWRKIILADGTAVPGLYDHVRDLFPDAGVFAAAADPGISEKIRSLFMDRDALGAVYLALKKHGNAKAAAGNSGISTERVMTAAAIFEEIGLARVSGNAITLLPSKDKKRIEDSKLWRLLEKL